MVSGLTFKPILSLFLCIVQVCSFSDSYPVSSTVLKKLSFTNIFSWLLCRRLTDHVSMNF